MFLTLDDGLSAQGRQSAHYAAEMVPSDNEYRELYRRLHDELLPSIQRDFADKEARRQRSRASLADFSRHAAANAFGTFVGGIALIIAGGLAGIITDLSAVAWIVIRLVAAVATGTLALIIIETPKSPEEEARRMAASLTALQVEVDVIRLGAESRNEKKREDQGSG